MNKELIELLLAIDTLIMQLEREITNPIHCALLYTLRVMFAEHFARNLTDEARAYFREDGLVKPEEIAAILPKIRKKEKEIIELLTAENAPSEFYISFLEGKIIGLTKPDETNQGEQAT